MTLKPKILLHSKVLSKNAITGATIELWDQESERARAGRCSEVGVEGRITLQSFPPTYLQRSLTLTCIINL